MGGLRRQIIILVSVLAAMVLSCCSLRSSDEENNTDAPPMGEYNGAEFESISGIDSTREYWSEERVGNDELKSDKVFHYSQISALGTFDPAYVNSIPDANITYHIYEGLYRTVDGATVPAGAASVDISDDGLTYVFHLNPDAKWSDGETVKAEDYVYGIRRRMDPKVASPTAGIGDVLQNGTAVRTGAMPLENLGVKAEDDSTLVITLEHRTDYFLSMLQESGFSPVRSDYVEKYGSSFCAASGKQVYNGPFVLRSTAEKMVVLEKNPYYWNASGVHLDRVVIFTAIDSEAALRMYLQGELDFVEIPASISGRFGNSFNYINGTVDFAVPNLESRYLSNRNLRLAISYALNRDELSAVSAGEPCLRYVLPYVDGVDGGTYGRQFPYEAIPSSGDKELAKEYLRKALDELDCDADDINLRAVIAESAANQNEAMRFAAQVKDVLGISIDLTMVSYNTRNAVLKPHSDEFDIAFAGWTPDYPDARSFLELFLSNGSLNYGNYSNLSFDGWLERASVLSGTERLAALFEAEKLLLDDGAVFAYQVRSGRYLLNSDFTHIGTCWIGHSLEFIFGGKNG